VEILFSPGANHDPTVTVPHAGDHVLPLVPRKSLVGVTGEETCLEETLTDPSPAGRAGRIQMHCLR